MYMVNITIGEEETSTDITKTDILSIKARVIRKVIADMQIMTMIIMMTGMTIGMMIVIEEVVTEKKVELLKDLQVCDILIQEEAPSEEKEMMMTITEEKVLIINVAAQDIEQDHADKIDGRFNHRLSFFPAYS